MVNPKEDIKELSLEELEAHLISSEIEPYRAKQIFDWIYRKGAISFSMMTNLPVTLRGLLDKKFRALSSEIAKRQISRIDGTRKYLFRLDDEEAVEAVLIPSGSRATACLSSQAGCAFGCKFCASGLKGFKRNLRSAEMLDEVLGITNDIKGRRITNIVIMGMGEPLANYDNVMKAVRILNLPYGFGIGARKITISTAGDIPGITRFMSEKTQIELSVSLHAADDKTRSELMPINKKYPLKELMRVCREYTKNKNRVITFEYILIKEINSSRQNALALAKLLRDLSCKVNLIPFNPVSSFDFLPPPVKEIKDFHETLKKNGINSTIRASRGADILAACGQLRYNTYLPR